MSHITDAGRELPHRRKICMTQMLCTSTSTRAPVVHPRLHSKSPCDFWPHRRTKVLVRRSNGLRRCTQVAQLRTRLGETEGMLATLRSRNELQARELHELRASAASSSQQQQQVWVVDLNPLALQPKTSQGFILEPVSHTVPTSCLWLPVSPTYDIIFCNSCLQH